MHDRRGWGGLGELFTCPRPLKVQACLPRDRSAALRSKVSGQYALPYTRDDLYLYFHGHHRVHTHSLGRVSFGRWSGREQHELINSGRYDNPQHLVPGSSTQSQAGRSTVNVGVRCG